MRWEDKRFWREEQCSIFECFICNNCFTNRNLDVTKYLKSATLHIDIYRYIYITQWSRINFLHKRPALKSAHMAVLW